MVLVILTFSRFLLTSLDFFLLFISEMMGSTIKINNKWVDK